MDSQRTIIILFVNLAWWLIAFLWSSQPLALAGEVPLIYPNNWPEVKIWPASSTLVISNKEGVLLSQGSYQPRPIASLTKLVTALIVLDAHPNWSAKYTLKNEDQRYGNIIYVYPGEVVTVKDLWVASLLASDNTATEALIQAVGLNDEIYYQKVEELAKKLNIDSDLRLIEPTGLNPDNQASARAMAIIVNAALSQPDIKETLLLDKYEIITQKGRRQLVTNTDSFIRGSVAVPDSWQLLGGKTGYLDEAGYCFAALWRNDLGEELVTVVLGAPTKEGRFTITKDLLDYITEKYY